MDTNEKKEEERNRRKDFIVGVQALLVDMATRWDDNSHYGWCLDQLTCMVVDEDQRYLRGES